MKNKIIILGSIILFVITFIYSRIDKVSLLSNSNTYGMNNVYFDNLEVLSRDTGYAKLEGNNITYDIDFDKPGDVFKFSFDIINPTRNNMYINTLKVTGTDSINYLSYSINYEDGRKVNIDDMINRETMKKVIITINYDDVDISSLPNEDMIVDLGLEINISM